MNTTATTFETAIGSAPLPQSETAVHIRFTGHIPPKGHMAWGQANLARATAHALKHRQLVVVVGHGDVDPISGFAMHAMPVVLVNPHSPGAEVFLAAADFVLWAEGTTMRQPLGFKGLEHFRLVWQRAVVLRDHGVCLALGRLAQAIENGTTEQHMTSEPSGFATSSIQA